MPFPDNPRASSGLESLPDLCILTELSFEEVQPQPLLFLGENPAGGMDAKEAMTIPEDVLPAPQLGACSGQVPLGLSPPLHRGFAQALGTYVACPVMSPCECQPDRAFQLPEGSLAPGHVRVLRVFHCHGAGLTHGDKSKRFFQPSRLCR